MAGRWVMLTIVAMVSVSAAGAVGDVNVPPGLLNAVERSPALSALILAVTGGQDPATTETEDPAPTESDDPVPTDPAATLNRAQQAITGAVGIPDSIRERLLGQVGGQKHLDGSGQPSTVGLDLAALMTAHANEMGHRPETVPGLDNAATHISEQAQAALSLVPSQWIRDHLVIAGTETTQPTE